jgi:mono/diheme cytochrome c family protein
VPLALSGYQTGLLAVALVFIAFALVVALVVPRTRPDFPARRLGWFIAVVIVLFIAQLTAVLLLAELGEEEHEAVETTETMPTETETGGTTTETGGTTTETDGTTTEPAPPPAPGGGEGDAAAGKQVFATAGCTTCHTLADAGASGTVGPNLDEAKPPYDLVLQRVTNGMGVMPPFKDQLSEQQIKDVAAYVSSAAGA